jgi:hypothetical protein
VQGFKVTLFMLQTVSSEQVLRVNAAKGFSKGSYSQIRVKGGGMSKGLGRMQKDILGLLLKAGGALATAGLLVGLFGGVPKRGTKRDSLIRSSLSRSLWGLRKRELIEIYAINTGGLSGRVVAIMKTGVEMAQAQGIEGKEPPPAPPGHGQPTIHFLKEHGITKE